MLSFEIFTRKLIKQGNHFKKDSEQYKTFEEMKSFYNEDLRDMCKVCGVAKKLCNKKLMPVFSRQYNPTV